MNEEYDDCHPERSEVPKDDNNNQALITNH
jgi:hypothetical protein